MKNNVYKQIACLIASFLFGFSMYAQNLTVDDYSMSFAFKTIKKTDKSRTLEVAFIGKNKEDRKDKLPVYNAEIQFFNVLDDVEIALGKSNTNNEGIAQLIISNKQKYVTDADGYIHLIARFEGSDLMDAEEEELLIKDVQLELYLEEIDSIKTIVVKAYTLDSIGAKTPIEEVDVQISIEGMLSKMKIKEGTIENGEVEFELTDNIPGDINKNFTVYAQILDNDEFGDVQQKQTVQWGTFTKVSENNGNTLWSKGAPIWMYIVLTILLVGVWANFAYTIINLKKIKNDGKTLETSTK